MKNILMSIILTVVVTTPGYCFSLDEGIFRVKEQGVEIVVKEVKEGYNIMIDNKAKKEMVLYLVRRDTRYNTELPIGIWEVLAGEGVQVFFNGTAGHVYGLYIYKNNIKVAWVPLVCIGRRQGETLERLL